MPSVPIDLAVLPAHGGSKTKLAHLDEALATCERQLEKLECQAAAMRVRIESSGSAGQEGENEGLRESCLHLSQLIENVAADALEHGCSRVPGAMDIFESANAAVERVATCLQVCRSWESAHSRESAQTNAPGCSVPAPEKLDDQAAEGHNSHADPAPCAVEMASGIARQDAAHAVAQALAIAVNVGLPPPVPENSVWIDLA